MTDSTHVRVRDFVEGPGILPVAHVDALSPQRRELEVQPVMQLLLREGHHLQNPDIGTWYSPGSFML